MYQKNNVIEESDAVEFVKSLPNDSINLVLTDPAYESLERWRSLGTTTRLKHSKGSSNDWFQTFPNNRYDELFKEFYRVLKPGSHLYMFCDEETRDLICTGYSPQTNKSVDVIGLPPLIKAGFKYWKSLVWHKMENGMGYHYRACHEFIIMAEKVIRKGKHRKLNDLSTPDVLSFKRLKGDQYYPTEKPIDLISLLITQSTNVGDLVLDPFCGSGNVGQACEMLDRKYVLGDINIKEAIRRLKCPMNTGKAM